MKYLFFLLIIFTSVVNAQTAQGIIAKHIKAIGGKEKIDAVTTFQFQTEAQRIYYKKPDSWRIEHIEDGKIDQFSVIKGEAGWVVFGNGNIQRKEPFAIISDKFDNYLLGYLLIADQLKCKVKYLGIDEVTKAFKIEVNPQLVGTLKIYYTYYIDMASYMIIKVEEDGIVGMSTYFYEDYTTIAGIKIPLKVIEKNFNETREYLRTNVKINIPINNKQFEKPVAGKTFGFVNENDDIIKNSVL